MNSIWSDKCSCRVTNADGKSLSDEQFGALYKRSLRANDAETSLESGQA